MFVQNITRINIFLCRSEYDPFIRVAGSCCADITAKYIRCPERQKNSVFFSDKNCCVHTVPVVFYLQGHLWYPHKRNILTSLPSDSRMDPNCHLHRYLDVIYARLPYMYFRVCSYQIHIFRDPVGFWNGWGLSYKEVKIANIFYSNSPRNSWSPHFRIYGWNPKSWNDDLLYSKMVCNQERVRMPCMG